MKTKTEIIYKNQTPLVMEVWWKKEVVTINTLVLKKTVIKGGLTLFPPKYHRKGDVSYEVTQKVENKRHAMGTYSSEDFLKTRLLREKDRARNWLYLEKGI
ncbi:MAG: hypothetical protein J6I84_02890 [Bacilli bacterium]|nr:hypothetical protein [Bacilli bacterium]